ncbi:hypothetical protein Syun_012618 [Stephania yunnanensis]|uniref:Uncharacterized protein n=1 Tax=Stephania yunnanensis TaxID=152371 RepID=A0AAP0JZR0_9MAGN
MAMGGMELREAVEAVVRGGCGTRWEAVLRGGRVGGVEWRGGRRQLVRDGGDDGRAVATPTAATVWRWEASVTTTSGRQQQMASTGGDEYV